MARPHALIVDDSKTAQIRLKKMLGDYPLEVDVVSSAEEAIGYLQQQKPAVVFMDHHMDGMDGFQALEAIKDNPDTAAVPVIMYTAQEGEAYIERARSLGAIDILSKKVMKPSSLEASLKLIHIEPGKEKELDRAEKAADRLFESESHSASVLSLASSGGSRKVHSNRFGEDEEDESALSMHITHLLDAHNSGLRSYVKENSQILYRRLTRELENARLGKPLDIPDDDIDDSVALESSDTLANKEPDKTAILKLLLIFALIGLVIVGYYIVKVNNKIEAVSLAQTLAIADSTSNQQVLRSIRDSQLQVSSPAQIDNDLPLLEALSWAVDLDLTFDFQEAALDTDRVKLLEELVDKLSYAGFQGIVNIDVHLGNFCVTQDLDGRFSLAKPDTPLSQCRFVENLDLDYTANDFISNEYINFEQSSAPIQTGKLDAQIFFIGHAQPRSDYPAITTTMTAGEWNTAARKNNRIAISFI